ncbi:hypothetical protein KGP36_01875 [Patescibacteria group bacterium]|nr:hypothetical protein [Patescibacteria group bacterium]
MNISEEELAAEAKRIRYDRSKEIHRVTLLMDHQLHRRLRRISPEQRKQFGPDIMKMLERYLDLRDKYGPDIFEGIYNHVTRKMASGG